MTYLRYRGRHAAPRPRNRLILTPGRTNDIRKDNRGAVSLTFY